MLGWMESVSLAQYASVSTTDTSFANAKIYSMQTQTQIANAGENARTHANAGRREDGGCGGGFVTRLVDTAKPFCRCQETRKRCRKTHRTTAVHTEHQRTQDGKEMSEGGGSRAEREGRGV